MAVCAWTLVVIPAWSQDNLTKGYDAFSTYLNATNASLQAADAGNTAEAIQQNTDATAALVQARHFLELGRAYDSDDLDTLTRYGLVLAEMHDYDLAAKTFRRVLKMTPDDPAVWLNLGRSLAETGAAKEAVEAFQRCINLSNGADIEAAARVDLGDLYLARGVHMLAEEQYTAALETSGERVDAKLALVGLKLRLGLAAEADQQLEAMGDIGAAYNASMQEYFVKALRDFDEARLWVQDDKENQMAYGKFLARVGRAADAIGPVKRALALDGQNYEAWNLLGYQYRRVGDTKKAHAAFIKSLEINAEQPEILDALQAPDDTR
jgi:Flp pilus assembly protein TadD